MSNAFDHLMAYQRETEALAQIAGRLSWDQETVMPEGAAEQRGAEMAAIEGVLHARRTDPRLADWLTAAEDETKDRGDDVAAAQLRLIRRSYDRSVKVPARLAAELARATSVGQTIWAKARAAQDVAAFLPTLAEIVKLRQEEGQALAQGRISTYDALIDDYEPGASAESLGAMFARLRPHLVDLRAACLDAPQPQALQGCFDAAGQMAVSDKLARAFGYDYERGRIDKAVHPFSSGSGNDVRITTRTDPADPFNCFYSTIHEVGHATYEQQIDQRFLLTPIGAGVSMGVHESQSRIYENQLGRSRAFTGWLYGVMRDQFGDIGVTSEDEFYRTANRVSNGFIRTEADEVQYNLHVLMRFDLERALIAGDLAVGDLEAAWNDRFKADFGVAVENPAQGCLQDVHWAAGLFGYFPTYSLGNVYAGALHQALRADLPDLDASLAQGDASPATGWLRDKLQVHGSLRNPQDTIRHAIGTVPDEGALIAYLQEKYAAIYAF